MKKARGDLKEAVHRGGRRTRRKGDTQIKEEGVLGRVVLAKGSNKDED